MKLQDQRWFRGPVFDKDGHETDKGGDCFATCIASLLDIDIKDFPNFHSGSDPESITHWWHKWNAYLYDNYRQVLVYNEKFDKIGTRNLAYWIAGVEAGSSQHSVIFHRNEFEWDPAPEGRKKIYTLDNVIDQVLIVSISNLYKERDE